VPERKAVRHVYHVVSLIVCGLLAACATVPPAFEPQTSDERAIVRLLQTIESGYNTGNVDEQLAPYAPDAIIETLLAGGKAVSRDEFAVMLRAQMQQSTIVIRPIAVRILSTDQAEAEAIVRRAPSAGGEIIGRRMYRLVRREGQWRIIEARYVP